ncbi:MAG TPA: AMP-binding protein [Quisquiliibacterium sp.]|nr:AMP-binding protein [Quisquiliibacterium sp.]
MTKPAPMTPQQTFDEMVAQGDVVIDRFDAWVATQPDKVFIDYGEDDIRLGFGEFARRADAVAAGLVGLGAVPGDRVSVMTRNSLVATLVMFACWRIGAIYAPVNFNYKGKLLSYQLNDTQPSVFVVGADCAQAVHEVLAETSIGALVLHLPRPGDHDFGQGEVPAGFGAGRRLAELADVLRDGGSVQRLQRAYSDPANIIYTSGTTGPAKGVLQSFRWMNQYAYVMRNLNANDDVIYCDLPLYHVGGAHFLIARAAWNGNTVGLWDKFSANTFWDRIARTGCSTGVLVDVMIPWLMSGEPRASDRENTLNKIHMQPLPMNHHAVAKRFGIDFVTCGFGQTEAGMGCGALIDEWGDEQGTPKELWRGPDKAAVRAAMARFGLPVIKGDTPLAKGFMGLPSPLLEGAVLDPQDNQCADGEVGQLAFRPRFPSLILEEYFKKPEATIRTFRNCWFHTGDACYRGKDGLWYFVDRMGGFFRVRGENISSYQVEDLINGHPKVRATAAVPVPADVGDEEDVAVFVELKEGESMTDGELRDYAREVMPKYMVPKHIRFIPALPLTPTNKVEKYKLKQQLIAELGKAPRASA